VLKIIKPYLFYQVEIIAEQFSMVLMIPMTKIKFYSKFVIIKKHTVGIQGGRTLRLSIASNVYGSLIKFLKNISQKKMIYFLPEKWLIFD
jgi:hypothetical protein